MQAFKPRPFIFTHACANCKFAQKLNDVHGSALVYICTKNKESTRRLPGMHICDVEEDGNGEQLSWFDDPTLLP